MLDISPWRMVVFKRSLPVRLIDWGLRDYGTAIWQGGDPICEHSPADTPTRRGIASSTLGGGKETTGHQREGYGSICKRCGAIRIDAQIGLERVPDCLGWSTGRPCGECYVCHIVAVMRECWRVLRDDGVCWLNMGDSYASGEVGRHDSVQANNGRDWSGTRKSTIRQQAKLNTGLKPKDLCMVPARVALALQAAGWYLRSEIVWSKPNPMPESVTDRPTKAHEMIYLLTKEPRYYYDAEAIKEKYEGPMYLGGMGRGLNKDRNDGGKAIGANGTGRNRRSVWTVATSPYSGAHFATFPPALVEPMILAGTSARGACPTCGKAWMRVLDKTQYTPEVVDPGMRFFDDSRGDKTRKLSGKEYNEQVSSVTIGWRPACACYDVPPLPDEPDDTSNGNMAAYRAEQARLLDLYAALPVVPCIVLDPFAGSGTVGKVAVKHGRRFVGCELNREYIDLAFERTSKVQVAMQL